ncbi:MAG: acyltransferase [Ignavibacteriae bacterium]|nr:MAG: acyltransferase [Ignavibacteriota bacterium]
MRVAVVQTCPIFGEVKKNVALALSLMESAAADLYVLPELFNTGYNFNEEAELKTLAETAESSTFRMMHAWSKNHACYIVYGFAERADKIYNSAALIGPEGVRGLYRKVHLFDRENLFFAPGNLGFPVFELPFGTIGLMICFDWIYPESARSLALKGAQLVAHPSNLVLPHCPDSMVTRCLENRIYTATADRVGEENRGGRNLKFIGSSEIVAPNGEILCKLGASDPAISVVELDLALAKNKQINNYNHVIDGRRPDQYHA